MPEPYEPTVFVLDASVRVRFKVMQIVGRMPEAIRRKGVHIRRNPSLVPPYVGYRTGITLNRTPSVLISLLGSGAAERLLAALPDSVLMADRTFQEILRDPSNRIPAADVRQALAKTGLVEVRSLDADQTLLYLELTSASNPNRLDEGEAATVALAVGCGAIPVLDEKKGRRVYRARFPGGPLESAAGLFRRLHQQERLPLDELRELLFQALRHARMHVAPEEKEWVIGILGLELAGQCSFLGRRG